MMRIPRIFLLASLALTSLLAEAANPVIEGLPLSGTAANVDPLIPLGKALVLPLTAYADDGGPVTLAVSSSNPYFFARVRSGSPLLRLRIKHAGSGINSAVNPTFEGDLVFQLFRDVAPRTADYVGGFAQGGFYDQSTGHPGLTFHRLADLNDDGDLDTPAVPPAYIFQGGDPLGTGSGGPGFSFRNEFSPAMIFAGRGQLAMANSGYDPTTKKATNGSQFFITDAPLRGLDFSHTIFGQLLEGWNLLSSLRRTAVTNEKPDSDVTITESEVVAQYNDGTHRKNGAVLLLSSIAVGSSTITVVAVDSAGNRATQTFTVNAERDTYNDPPFLVPLENRVGPKAAPFAFPFTAVDLERDYLSIQNSLLNNGSGTSTKAVSAVARGLLAIQGSSAYQASVGNPTAAYVGPVTAALSVTQFDPARRASEGVRGVDDYTTVTAAIGDLLTIPIPVFINGSPNVALNNVIAGRFRDSDPQATATGYTAKINWGDGFTVAATGTVTAESTQAGPGFFKITGSHTYSRAGQFPVVVTVTSAFGLVQEIRSTAVITAGTLRLQVGELSLAGQSFTSREIGRFTDGSTPGAETDYTAAINWGDGLMSPGAVRSAGNGEFIVYGTHVFRDAEDFALTVRVHRKSDPAAADTSAWGRLLVRGFAAVSHAPPYSFPHLVTEITTVPINKQNPLSGDKPTKETVGTVGVQSQTFLTYSVILLNAGNVASPAGGLYLLLSPDTNPNLSPTTNSNGVAVPADQAIEWGPPISSGSNVRRRVVTFPALQPGEARQYTFEASSLGDYRLRMPPNETGTGLNLLAYAGDASSFVGLLPTDHAAAVGPIQGISISPEFINTSEAGGSAQFTVRLDKKPKADVIIPLSGDPTEGTLSSPSLRFTPDNWLTPQVVTVTGKADSDPSSNAGADGNQSYLVQLGAAQSNDPIYDGMNGPDVIVTNADIDANIRITPTSLTTTEASGTGHEKTFTMTLQKKPTSTVNVQIILSDTTEGQIKLPGASAPVPVGQAINFTFDPAQSDVLSPKTVTVIGLDDASHDGDVTYTISFKATSSDPQFSGITPSRITVKNTDDDL